MILTALVLQASRLTVLSWNKAGWKTPQEVIWSNPWLTEELTLTSDHHADTTDRFTTALDKAVNLKCSFLAKLKDAGDIKMQDHSSHKPKEGGHADAFKDN